MENFLRRFHAIVLGVLCGWDRIRLQGSRRWLAGEVGFKHYFDKAQVRWMDFRDHAMHITERLRQDVEQREADQGRKVHYLPSSASDKEEQVRKFIDKNEITE